MFLSPSRQRPACRKILGLIICLVLFFIGAMAIASFRAIRSLRLPTPEGGTQSADYHTTTTQKMKGSELLSNLLGFTKPQTYLLLFQNNTELRPGGGFIGSYAVVRLDHGRPKILKVEGTETLDRSAPQAALPDPPAPIQKYLGVSRWYMRDGNWSPDFAQSAGQILALYRAEQGTAASDITIVVGITPTVIERLLKLTGDITVDGIKFSSNNVTEKLEYEVEYGFSKRGLKFTDRKNILGPFMRELMADITKNFLFHPYAYADLFTELTQESQLLLFTQDQALENLAISNHADGQVQMVAGDFLMWIDANLAALKTDYALTRTLDYRLIPSGSNYLGQARMEYWHRGVFDWRTTRYRTYTRVYVPLGSTLKSVTIEGGKNLIIPLSAVASGQELGKTWFGTFISIEPGEIKQLKFTYELPYFVSDQIQRNMYTLFVQKQIGSIAHGLTLDLNFAKIIQAATPPEAKEEWGDNQYQIKTNLRQSRNFQILLKP